MPLHHLFFVAVYASRRLRKADFQTHSEKEITMYSTSNRNAKTNKNPIGVPPTTPKAHQKARGKKDIKQTITDRIVSLMEQGSTAWQKTWKDAAAAGMPTNAITSKPYKGINVLVLWSHRIEQGFQSNKWMTYRQAKSVGAQVRKGERSITCIYFQMVEKKKKKEGAEDKKEFLPLMRADRKSVV